VDYRTAKANCPDSVYYYVSQTRRDPITNLFDENSYECLPQTREHCPTCFATPLEMQLAEIARQTGQQVLYVPPESARFGYAPGLLIGTCPEGTHQVGALCAKNLKDKWDPGDFFSQIGVQVAQAAGRVASAVATGGTSIALEAATEIIRAQQERLNVGIDLGGIFGGVATALGGISSGSYLTALQGAAQLGSSFASHSTPSYAMPSYGIVPYSPPPIYQQQAPVQAQPVGAFAVAGRAIATLTAPILAKIAVKLGLRSRPSLTRAMDMVRKAAKLLTSPEAVAAALGITVGELATLITTSNARKRRRMNPANSKALRRAARRIKSFHRLCTHTDVLKNRSRRSAVSRCGTCKKAPCRC
jgi:hypothetical protein